MCMQAANVAHEGAVTKLKSDSGLCEDRLKVQEDEIKKLTENAEESKQSALKRQDELSEKLDSKDKELEMVQGEAAERAGCAHACADATEISKPQSSTVEATSQPESEQL